MKIIAEASTAEYDERSLFREKIKYITGRAKSTHPARVVVLNKSLKSKSSIWVFITHVLNVIYSFIVITSYPALFKCGLSLNIEKFKEYLGLK